MSVAERGPGVTGGSVTRLELGTPPSRGDSATRVRARPFKGAARQCRGARPRDAFVRSRPVTGAVPAFSARQPSVAALSSLTSHPLVT